MAIMDNLRKLVFMQNQADQQNQNNLLSTNQAQSGLLGGLMDDPTARLLIGANILGAGVKGTDPFSAITPAVLQTAQIQKALTPKVVKSDLKNFKKGNEVITLDLSNPQDKQKSRKLLEDGYMVFSASVQSPDIGSLSKAAKNKQQQTLIDNVNLVNQLNKEKSLFEDEFLTIGGKAKYELLKKKDLINPQSLSNDERFYLSGYDSWLQTNLQYFNQYRKLITGVAAGEKEIGWLQSSIPSTKDSPTSYRAKINNQIKITERLINNAKTFLSEKGVSAIDSQGQFTPEYIEYLKQNKFAPTKQEIEDTVRAYKIQFGDDAKAQQKIISILDADYSGLDWRKIVGIN